MSEPEALDGDAVGESAQLSPQRIATGTILLFLVLFLILVGVRLAVPASWEFAVEVDTEVASLTLQPGVPTRWRIDGATLCAREHLSLPDTALVADPRAACGSRTWRGWHLDLPEQVLTLEGGATAMMETTDGGLSVSLRAGEGASLGMLEVVGSVPETALGQALNLFWTADAVSSLSFPFTAATTLGRAVSWSDPRMLRAGTVTVFTADDSADRRTQVDQADLMLGDQVTLAGAADDLWPKGFVRPAADLGSLAVVAFGRADSLTIQRYGESGYDFRPGPLARLANDPAIAFWGSLLAVYMSIALGVVQFMEGRSVKKDDAPRFFRWLYRYPE